LPLHSSYLPLGVPNGLVIHHAQGRLLHIIYESATSIVRLFEIADRCAKAEEGRLFVHNLPEALPPKPKSKDPKHKEAAALATGTAPSVIKVDDAATVSSTR
jgi:hypothetical protein